VLIERTTRRQTTTLVGVAVYEQCRQMLDSAKEAVVASESEATEAKGALRIAAPDAFAKQVLEPLLLEFMGLVPCDFVASSSELTCESILLIRMSMWCFMWRNKPH